MLRNTWRIGLVAALVLLVVTFIDFVAEGGNPEYLGMDGMWLIFSLVLIAALLIQHRWPGIAVALAGLGAFVHLAILLIPLKAVDLAVAVTLYSLASRARARWIAITALALVLAGG